MAASPRKIRWLIAVAVLANCVPWLVYRLFGSCYLWPQDHPLRPWEPEWVSVRFEGIRAPAYHFAFMVLTLAQVQLFSVWATFGRKPPSWRFAYLLACLGLLTRMHVCEPTIHAWSAAKHMLLHFYLGCGFCAALCLLSCRLAGIRLAIPSEPPGEGAREADPVRRQFSIAYMLWWTTGLAVFFALWQWMITPPETWYWLHLWPRYALAYLSMSLMTPAALWLAVGTRYLVLRIALLGLGVLCSCCWQYEPFSFGQGRLFFAHFGERARLFVPVALWIVATLWTFRAAGYRLQWRRRVLL